MLTKSRRQFLGTAAGSLASFAILPRAGVYAGAADDALRVGLVGCGGRGAGCSAQTLSTNVGKVRLVAMADLSEERIESTLGRLRQVVRVPGAIDVPRERQFVGLDAYAKLLASGVDAVLLATPPGFRPLHLETAIRAGVHTFMEKPVAVDVPGARRVLAASKNAKSKNLKIGVGFQRAINSRTSRRSSESRTGRSARSAT